MSSTIVYHGSYTKIQKPEIIEGRHTKDLGTGFYCTIIKEQAERWAKRYDTPMVNSYQMLIDGDFKILEFKTMTEEWLDFIVRCRNGSAHDYDIVIGPMADDQIYNYITEFVNGDITRKQFWVMAEFKYPTQQINFCNDKALKCIRFNSCEVVK